jgi:multimeric flavodoxin WrbA
MRFILCNGSPHGDRGATAGYIKALETGIRSTDAAVKTGARSNDTTVESVLLVKVGEHPQVAEHAATADLLIVAFPLYTDAMPGITMAFFEALEPYIGRMSKVRIGFIVQSGFPEKNHSKAVEKYLERLVSILGAQYIGTAIFGGGMMMTKKREKLISKLGASLGSTGYFDPALSKKTTPMDRLGLLARVIVRLMAHTPFLNFYWDQQLKANGVYEKRFDRPYAPGK